MAVGNVVQLAGTVTKANAPIKAVCLYNDGTYAVMQSYGFGNGAWPGSGALSAASYKTSTGSYGVSNMTLPTGTLATNLQANGVTNRSSDISTALQTAAGARNSFGATNANSWLGTPYGESNAYYIWAGGGANNDPRTNNNVVAPAFNLGLLYVKIDKSTMTLYM